MTIRLRLVTCNDLVSAAIRFAEDYEFSHVEAVMGDGTYLGAHADGGVQARPPDYDKGKWTKQLFVDLPCDDAMAGAFEAACRHHIGEPYDYESILGFVLRESLHDKQHVICSAFQAQCLRQIGWFAYPLAIPPHEISPRDLALAVSARAKFGPIETPIS